MVKNIMKGWVYIITNPSLPNVIKVGYSKSDPKLRAQQFNTGAPDDYVVEYDALVDEPNKVEKQTHLLLRQYDKRKEWFKCDISVAIVAIRQAASHSIMHEFFREKEKIEIQIELDRLITWANNNKIPEINLPRDKHRLLTIKKLNLTDCNVDEIPDSIGNLPNLTKLYLSCNNIHEVPKSIRNLTNLTHFDLSSNQLACIPDVISDLSNLTHLYLSDNKIAEIPDFVGNLINLNTLTLSQNKITKLPKSIGQLVNLNHLDLRWNNIEILEPELNYLRDAIDFANFW